MSTLSSTRLKLRGTKPDGTPLARARRAVSDHSTGAVLVLIAAASAVMYASAVGDTGFYYDDWLLQARFGDAGSRSPGDVFGACQDPAGRPGGCLYHGTVYLLLGSNAAAYHAMSIVFLIGSTLLLYLVLVGCRVPRTAALIACLLYIVYPGSDSTRLWPTAIGAQYILAGYLGGVLLALAALRSSGRRSLLLHGASVALFLLILLTYEVVVPLVAIAGVLYFLTVRSRAALVRGGVDVALVVAFLVYRLVLNPVPESAGFLQERTAGELVDRVGTLITGAWRSFHYLFVPNAVSDLLAWALAVFAGLVVALALALRPECRSLIVRWMVLAGLAVLFALAAMSSYTMANDLTVPTTAGLLNRFNLGSAPAYAVLAAALTALLWDSLRALLGHGRALAAAFAIPAILVGYSMAGVSFEHQDAYAESWRAQRASISAIVALDPEIPDDATVIAFGHPIWEEGFVPVFSASWDLRGAIDERTSIDPPQALPYLDGLTCGPAGLLFDGAPWAPYRGRSPVVFVNTRSREVRYVSDAAGCQAGTVAWGPIIFWGRTVTG